MYVLEAKNVGITFGGLRAVDNFNIKIGKNELVGLIGPNGAGKTTIFNMLTGVYVPTDGDVIINGKKINGMKASKVCNLGASRTFQNIRLFNNLSVRDNIKIAIKGTFTYNTLDAVFRTKKYYLEESKANEKVKELLSIFNMENEIDNLAKNLPYGKQRKLEICRALATNASIILFDEPAAGMNPQETLELMNVINLIREKFGVSILLIEHDMNLVMGICEKLVVINYGRTIATGTPAEVKANKEVIKAYLGD